MPESKVMLDFISSFAARSESFTETPPPARCPRRGALAEETWRVPPLGPLTVGLIDGAKDLPILGTNY